MMLARIAMVSLMLLEVSQAAPGSWNTEKLSLGEISLNNHDFHLPAITLKHEGSESSWPKSPQHFWDESLPDSTFEVPKEHEDSIKFNIKEVGVPVKATYPLKIPYIVPEWIPQPYPISVPVSKPAPYEVVKHVYKVVEKKVPIKVEQIVPVAVEKAVPYEVERKVPEVVIKKVPFKVPVYKTIVHKSKH